MSYDINDHSEFGGTFGDNRVSPRRGGLPRTVKQEARDVRRAGIRDAQWDPRFPGYKQPRDR